MLQARILMSILAYGCAVFAAQGRAQTYPAKTVRLIHDATVAALKSPAVIKRMSDLGYIGVGNLPGQFAACIRSKVEGLGRILRSLRGSLQ